MNKKQTLKLMAIANDLGAIQDLLNSIEALEQETKDLEEASEYWYKKYMGLLGNIKKFIRGL